MQKRRLGDSDVHITPITFGAWAIGGWMWGGQEEADSIEAMNTAIDLGITTIDTAAIYAFGYSEKLVGRVAKGRRDQLQILTKYGLRWDCQDGEFYFESEDRDGNPKKIYRNARKESILHECEQSLQRLGTDYIDLYQCHWRDHSTPLEETMEAMDILLKQGKIRAAGVSNFSREEIAACRQIAPVASDQPPFSMVHRGIENDVLPFCRNADVGLIVYSPLERGLLTGKFEPDHEFAEGDHRANNPYFKPENIRRTNAMLERIRPIAERHDATLAQLVIAWTIRVPGITAALVGARNADQARENARAGQIELTEGEFSQISEEVHKLELDVPEDQK